MTLKLVPQPNPTETAIAKMETILLEALTAIRYERMDALDREDRKSYEIANRVQGGLELLLGSLRSER